jgi:hypothetical protein
MAAKKNKPPKEHPVLGFLPCFEYYAHNRHPLEDIFIRAKPAYVNHIRGFLYGIYECNDLIDMRSKLTGKEIKPVRNNSEEAQRVNKAFQYPYQLYRVDYGDNSLRLYFGFIPGYRLINVVAVDLDHTYFN